MKIEKKYTAIQLRTPDHLTLEGFPVDEVVPNFVIGKVTGPYYNKKYPQEVFDTEEQAIKWAYEENEYAQWLILPIITFEKEY
jgi:hypothetical protein